jgi:putative phosphoesterase
MAPRLVKRSETLALRDGAMTIAVVADTHSAPHAATRAHLTAIAPDAILHAGDIGEARVIDELAEIAPVFAVRGNIDTRAAFPDILTIDLVGSDGRSENSDRTERSPGRHAGDAVGPEQRSEERSEDNHRRLRIFLTHIAVAGPRLRADVARMARAERASLVVCGHSHVPFIGQERELTVFNPGSIGPRRFHLPIVFGTIVVTPTRVRLAHVDCETGRAWTPP